MHKISIVTPTYNRGNLLINLYNSLLIQEIKDFQWIIIDDGSTDNTKKIVENFKIENKIEILYLKKKNGGKHTAINKAIDICDSELFFIVDSDDSLEKNSLKNILIIEESIKDKEKFCGISGMRSTKDGNLLSNNIKGDYIDATSLDATYKLKLFGDKAEVFYTRVLKKYRFKIFENEKFLTECTLWNKIATDGYLIRWTNSVICISGYREDGITKNLFNILLQNPEGNLYYLNQESSFNIPLKYKIKHQINYFRFGILAKKNILDLLKKSTKKRFFPISIIGGIVGIFYTKFKY